MNRNWLRFLLGVSAILVAGCAAYFSVTGLGVLFSGASIAVMIMAGSLEFAKLVSATYLKQRWKEIKGLNKWYLTSAVVILMVITSAGIFGFLSNAFQQQNIRLEQVQREIGVWENKIKSDSQQINSLTAQLNNLQSSQDKILGGGKINNRLLKSVDNRDKQSEKIQSKINSLVDSSASYTGKINQIKNENIGLEREIGGFRFVAESFNIPLNTVVKFFIILIVFVFDPLAIALVIAFNQVVLIKKEEDEKSKLEENDTDKVEASDVVSEVSRVRLSEEELNKLEEHLSNKKEISKESEEIIQKYKKSNNNSNKEKVENNNNWDGVNRSRRNIKEDDNQGPPINKNITSPSYEGETKEGNKKPISPVDPNITSPHYEGGRDGDKSEKEIAVVNPQINSTEPQNNVETNFTNRKEEPRSPLDKPTIPKPDNFGETNQEVTQQTVTDENKVEEEEIKESNQDQNVDETIGDQTNNEPDEDVVTIEEPVTEEIVNEIITPEIVEIVEEQPIVENTNTVEYSVLENTEEEKKN